MSIVKSPKLNTQRVSVRHAIHIAMRRLRIAQETGNKPLEREIHAWLDKTVPLRNKGLFIYIPY